jgi:hypothetical protein
MPSKRKASAASYPSEAQEQEQLAKWLDGKGVTYFAVPNGGLRAKRTAAALKRQGVKPGVPDLLIIDHAHMEIENEIKRFVGVALELKRQSERPKEAATDYRDQPFKGASEAQRRWLNRFSERGWISLVAYGALDAVVKLVYCNIIPIDRLEPAELVMLGLATKDEAESILSVDQIDHTDDQPSGSPEAHTLRLEAGAQPQEDDKADPTGDC